MPSGLAARLPSAAARQGQRLPAAAAHDARHGLLATAESGPGAAAAGWPAILSVIHNDLPQRNHGAMPRSLSPPFPECVARVPVSLWGCGS